MDQTWKWKCSSPRGLSLPHCLSASEQGTLLPQHLLPPGAIHGCPLLCVHCVLCPAVFTWMGQKQRTNVPHLHVVCVCGTNKGIWNLEEEKMLQEYSTRTETRTTANPFQSWVLLHIWTGSQDLFFNKTDWKQVDLYTAKGRAMYDCCVLTLNRSKLDVRTDTVWRRRLDVDSKVKTVWRVLYKPPLKIRTGDLQWRILHGAIAVNSFISIINPTVKGNCPFCGEAETVFHAFYDCKRLSYLFKTLQNVFKR